MKLQLLTVRSSYNQKLYYTIGANIKRGEVEFDCMEDYGDCDEYIDERDVYCWKPGWYSICEVNDVWTPLTSDTVVKAQDLPPLNSLNLSWMEDQNEH